MTRPRGAQQRRSSMVERRNEEGWRVATNHPAAELVNFYTSPKSESYVIIIIIIIIK